MKMSFTLQIGEPAPDFRLPATDGKTYCFYTETIDNIEKTCDFSCAYSSQTSSMNYHLNTTHKVYERKRAVCIVTEIFMYLKKIILILHILLIYIIGAT